MKMICYSMLAFFLLTACSNGSGPAAEGLAQQEAPVAPEESPTGPSPELQVEMLDVPAGLFLFGINEDRFQAFVRSYNIYYRGIEDALRPSFVIPQQSLMMQAFRMDMFEVTNEQYLEFIKSTRYSPRSNENYLKTWDTPSSFPDWAATFPVVWVSQEDAAAYCQWQGKRLPTEQEWEKAARGLDGRMYPWGNDFPDIEVTNCNRKQLEPVGNRPGDLSPFGIYDLAGNASELTSSTQPRGSTTRVVVKGGSYKAAPNQVTTFIRGLDLELGGRAEQVGFRCVADLE